LKGFPREQANLLSAIQSWIDEIGWRAKGDRFLPIKHLCDLR
jgi:hypothetical protein